ncbi:MAG: ribosome maturation factor RimP [Proteobacteria bacterium]|nr:ribosome maturation factor RimP [Pseudomonadota bacterium]
MAIYHTQQEAKVYDIVARTLEFMKYEIVRIRYRQGESSVLQIMIDRVDAQPLSIEDCEAASKQVSVMLDVDDVLHGQYVLEVSSPGLDRPLTRLKDFEKHIGEVIKISTFTPYAGARKFTGILLSANQETIILRTTDTQQEVPLQFENLREAILQPFAKKADRKKPTKNKRNSN